MNLHALDWIIVVVFLLALAALTLYCRRFVRTVADFLVGGRVAGRYLLSVSQGLGGAISIIALWEMLYAGGLPTQWWALMSVPVGLLLAQTGFVTYRFRQTRALTMAQFFEMRYSRRCRFFAGVLGWVSGIVNYGIFPAITARFLIYFIGLPPAVHLGSWAISTFPLVMAAYLGFALFTALTGGQISIMLTAFFQGAFTLTLFIVISIFLFDKFSWGDIVAGLKCAPPGQSMLNPFQSGKSSEFGIGYFLIAAFSQVYCYRAWQGTSGYNAAARTPHEAQMAGMLIEWRSFVQQVCLLLIPLAAFAVLHLPKFAALATGIQADLNAIHDPTIREQMIVPLFLTHVLPTGLMGLFAAVVVSAAISFDNSYLHSWGSIFIQDVVLPLRKEPVSAKTHLLLLRLSITGVALFGFTFSLLFEFKDYIFMYFALTGAIYLGGAGAVIIGGLYWKWGTTAGAWTAFISGSTLAFGGLFLQQSWAEWFVPPLRSFLPHNAWLAAHADKFPLDGMTMYLIALLTASTLYVLVSLLGHREEHNMDKLLHRGAYALPEDRLVGSVERKFSWKETLGLTREFTRGEQIFFWMTLGWSMIWGCVFFIGLAWNTLWGTTDAGWSWFWWGKLCLFFGIGIVVAVWVICGGLRDAAQLFRDLGRPHGNEEDDGRVTTQEKSAIKMPN